MRILHLSSYDARGGAAIAADLIHGGLVSAGIDSRMWVRRKHGHTSGVISSTRWSAQVIIRIRRRYELLRARMAGWNRCGAFSPGVAGGSLRPVIRRFRPEIVHLHWICDGFVSVRALAELDVPVVWTLHDMWPLTGGCHYAGSCRGFESKCGCCPLLGARRVKDLSHIMLRAKTEVFNQLELVVVSPSRWLAREAARSMPLHRCDIHVVPNGIDTTRFHPRPARGARQALGLPDSGILIVGGASRFRIDPRKGFDLFLRVIRELQARVQQEIRVAVFGTGARSEIDCDGLRVVELGGVEDATTLVSIYQAADFFLAPSREDNLPNTLLEALACGVPCAGFNIGGFPDVIRDDQTGCLAAPFDTRDLACRIAEVIVRPDRLAEMRTRARALAEAEFSIPVMIRGYTRIYEGLLEGRAGIGHSPGSCHGLADSASVPS